MASPLLSPDSCQIDSSIKKVNDALGEIKAAADITANQGWKSGKFIDHF